jgi:uncharacterized protein YndB with AHSA1/START domain
METATAENLNQENCTLSLTRTFNAPRSIVFNAWTKPEHLVRWWGPQGCTIPQCDMDVKEGGNWSTTMRHENNDESVVAGKYIEISEPDRLVFSWAWQDVEGHIGHETTVTVEFEEQNGQTTINFHQALFLEEDHRNLHEQGWCSSFECLDELLAQ